MKNKIIDYEKLNKQAIKLLQELYNDTNGCDTIADVNIMDFSHKRNYNYIFNYLEEHMTGKIE